SHLVVHVEIRQQSIQLPALRRRGTRRGLLHGRRRYGDGHHLLRRGAGLSRPGRGEVRRRLRIGPNDLLAARDREQKDNENGHLHRSALAFSKICSSACAVARPSAPWVLWL